MGRTVYIVARDHPELYAYLRERFTCDGEVDVILDRRIVQRRRVNMPRSPERRRTERRARPEADTELQIRSHAIITLSDA
jgi:hypothetical protein